MFNAIPTESMIREHQERYYQALEEAGSLGESTPFVEFMLEVILETIQKVGNKVGSKVGNELSENQQKIVVALRGNQKLSAQKLSDIIGTSKRKVEENLAKLKSKGVIKRIGGTRGHWEVCDNFTALGFFP